jgi:thiosulfate reductase cytochrome b subunit
MSYYLGGIFKNAKAPFPINQERKFNPIQQISYVSVMYILVPVVFVTGWALLFPEVVIRQIFGVSGLLLTDVLHITVGFLISLFLLIHIYFCTTGTRISSAFKSMINGWAEVH